MINQKAFDDYSTFEYEIKYKNRFFIDSSFLTSLKQAINLNSSVIPEGTKLFRGRIHSYESDKNRPLSVKEMFNPDLAKAIRGRANPDGISYLYLSSDIDTCIKEIAPKQNDIITVGEFVLGSSITLVNFINSFPSSKDEYLNSLNHCIRLAFSDPQITSRPELEYLPYQFICELIKNENFGGVQYYSSYDRDILTESYNLVLFEPTIAKTDESKFQLYKIDSVNFNYDFYK